MLAKTMSEATLVNKRLWPACYNEALSYQEQIRFLYNKIIELEEEINKLKAQSEEEANND